MTGNNDDDLTVGQTYAHLLHRIAAHIHMSAHAQRRLRPRHVQMARTLFQALTESGYPAPNACLILRQLVRLRRNQRRRTLLRIAREETRAIERQN